MNYPQFTGKELEKLVLEVEAAVGVNMAGCTPLGIEIIRLCEEAMDNDKSTSILSREGSK